MPYRVYAKREFESLKNWSGELGYHSSIVFPSSNEWGFPDIPQCPAPTSLAGLPRKLVAFNSMTRSSVGPDRAVHFFIQDNKFSACWTHPARSLGRLLDAHPQYVLGTDHSMYADWPRVVQMHSKFRDHWLAALWSQEGLRVVPSIGWSTPDQHSWQFEGYPTGGLVAVSSVGTHRFPETRELFLRGFEEMMRRLHPERILFYGRVPGPLRHLVQRISLPEDGTYLEEVPLDPDKIIAQYGTAWIAHHTFGENT